MSTTVTKAVVIAAPFAISALIKLAEYVIRKVRRPPRPPQPPPGISLQDMIDRARDLLDMDVIHYMNFAFCGSQGSGKSTLINSLRALSYTDPIDIEAHDVLDPAPTGEIETTRETKCYGCPIGHDLEFIRFWDHPGCGTRNYPSQNYFDANLLYAFDCVILVTAGGLGEYETQIIEAARRYCTSVCIVITKAEERVKSKIRKQPRAAGPLNDNARKILIQETINEAKISITRTLADIQHGDVPIFVVSAHRLYDFLSAENIEDYEQLMEIVPLLEYLINVALARRP